MLHIILHPAQTLAGRRADAQHKQPAKPLLTRLGHKAAAFAVAVAAAAAAAPAAAQHSRVGVNTQHRAPQHATLLQSSATHWDPDAEIPPGTPAAAAAKAAHAQAAAQPGATAALGAVLAAPALVVVVGVQGACGAGAHSTGSAEQAAHGEA